MLWLTERFMDTLWRLEVLSKFVEVLTYFRVVQAGNTLTKFLLKQIYEFYSILKDALRFTVPTNISNPKKWTE